MLYSVRTITPTRLHMNGAFFSENYPVSVTVYLEGDGDGLPGRLNLAIQEAQSLNAVCDFAELRGDCAYLRYTLPVGAALAAGFSIETLAHTIQADVMCSSPDIQARDNLEAGIRKHLQDLSEQIGIRRAVRSLTR